MLPTCIIIGAPKSGTSSLFQWLIDHPQVDGSKEKETYYFVDPGTHMFRSDRNVATGGIAGYEKIFEHCDPASDVLIEATPSYLYSETALRDLPGLETEPKFIVLLREPIAQLRSLVRYFQQNWNWIPSEMSFSEFIEAAKRRTFDFRGNELAQNAPENAEYVRHLRRWRAATGPGRLHVFLFEDMIIDPKGFMASIAKLLEIDPGFYDRYDFPVENETYAVKNQTLQDLNIRIRGLIPRGPTYLFLRNIYRRLNTVSSRGAPRVTAQIDRSAEHQLAAFYLATIDDLEGEFHLDLSRWRRKLEHIAKADDRDQEDAGQGHGNPDGVNCLER